jgi:predicted permease
LQLSQLLTTLAVIAGSLTTGYLYRLRSLGRTSGDLDAAATADGLRRLAARLQKAVITSITPVVLVNTFWGLRLSSGTLAFFPILGALSHLIGGTVALALSRRFGHTRKQAGAMFTSGAFTNLASFGALVTFMFYGEAGYALAALFKLFEPIVYFSIGFPIAKLFSDETPPGTRFRLDLRALARDRIVLLPVCGILAGSLLNATGLARPAFIGSIIPPLVMLSTSMMLLSVGINMRPAAVGGYLREAAAIASIKHLLMPATMATLGYLLGFHEVAGGLALRVLVTMASLPVAFNSLIPPSLYGLDTDLANSSWIVSTGLFASVVLPLLYLLSRVG